MNKQNRQVLYPNRCLFLMCIAFKVQPPDALVNVVTDKGMVVHRYAARANIQ